MSSREFQGYTLLEILVSVTLMLMIMLGITQLFSRIGTVINESQETLQMTSQLRGAKTRLESDLRMITADLSRKPVDPKSLTIGSNKGYFCLCEGMGAPHSSGLLRSNGYVKTEDIALNVDFDKNLTGANFPYDQTVGDLDDVLMFTAKAPAGQYFRGLVGGVIEESDAAEIIWFVRGTTLYRRVLLIIPNDVLQSSLSGRSTAVRAGKGFYNQYDVSVRLENGEIVANTLEDLTRRENRFAHQGTRYPHNIYDDPACYYLRMPTLTECSYYDYDNDEGWIAGASFYSNLPDGMKSGSGNSGPCELTYELDGTVYDGVKDFFSGDVFEYIDDLGGKKTSDFLVDNNNSGRPFIDFWNQPLPWSEIDQKTGNLKPLQGPRPSEDVLLTNVISFDVQVWDPVSKRYINLGEGGNGGLGTDTNFGTLILGTDGSGNDREAACSVLGTQGLFALNPIGWNNGKWYLDRSVAANSNPMPCVYDTWSEAYELPGNAVRDAAGNTQYAVGMSGIDDPDDKPSQAWTSYPPYNVPLSGVKITIRTFDPRSRNVKEMSIVHEFTGK